MQDGAWLRGDGREKNCDESCEGCAGAHMGGGAVRRAPSPLQLAGSLRLAGAREPDFPRDLTASHRPPPRTCRDSGSQARLSVSSSSEACSSWCTSNRTLPVFEHTPTRAPLKDPPEDGGLAAGAGLCSAIIAWDSNLLISCRHETHPTPSTHWLPRGGLPGTGSAGRGLLPARAAQPQTRLPSAPAQPRARRRPAQRA